MEELQMKARPTLRDDRSEGHEEWDGGTYEYVAEMDEGFDIQGSREDWAPFVIYLDTLDFKQYAAMKYRYRTFPRWIWTESDQHADF